MINTFGPFDFTELKDHITRLLNKSESFSVICIKDRNDQIHHWEVREGIDASE